MPRKNARPAAKKAAARKKARMAENAKPKRRGGMIADHHTGILSLAGLALMAHRFDKSS